MIICPRRVFMKITTFSTFNDRIARGGGTANRQYVYQFCISKEVICTDIIHVNIIITQYHDQKITLIEVMYRYTRDYFRSYQNAKSNHPQYEILRPNYWYWPSPICTHTIRRVFDMIVSKHLWSCPVWFWRPHWTWSHFQISFRYNTLQILPI